MKKRFLAYVMAAAMAMGCMMTVSAADTVINTADLANAAEVSGNATVSLPVIKVTVPTSVGFIINPFKMEYTATGTDGLTSGVTGNDQIISAVQTIKSESNVAVKVNISDLYAVVPMKEDGKTAKVTMATANVLPTVTTKSMFLYLDMTEVSGSDATAAGAYTFPAGFTAGKPQLAIPAKKASGVNASKTAIITIPSGGSSKTAKLVAFRIAGNMAANPVNATTKMPDPWVDGDKVEIGVKFTFEAEMVK